MSAPLGQKARDILAFAALPENGHRAEPWRALVAAYSNKSVHKKIRELANQGYLHLGATVHQSWLTDKGRSALESSPMRG